MFEKIHYGIISIHVAKLLDYSTPSTAAGRSLKTEPQFLINFFFLFFQTPHLVNLNEDPLMSECLLYYIKDGITR